MATATMAAATMAALTMLLMLPLLLALMLRMTPLLFLTSGLRMTPLLLVTGGAGRLLLPTARRGCRRPWRLTRHLYINAIEQLEVRYH